MMGKRRRNARGQGWLPQKTASGNPGPTVNSLPERSRQPAVISLLGVLTILVFWGALLAMGSGCSTSREHWGLSEGQAQDFFSKVRPISGDTSWLMRNAHYYQMMGRPELALKELEEAHATAPDNLKIVNMLASCYEQLGNYSRAEKLYQEALARDGANAALANNLCFSYYLAGKWVKAETCFKEALARDPNNQAARNNLGLLYCRLGRLQEAHRLWQEAEGAAAADQNVKLALGVLGLSVPPAYAQSHGAPQPGAAVKPSPVAQPAAPTAAVGAPARPAASLAKPGEIPAAPPGGPPGRAAAETPAKTPKPLPVAAVQAPTPAAASPAKPLKSAAKPVAPPPALAAAAAPAAPRVEAAAGEPKAAPGPKMSPPAARATTASLASQPPRIGPKYLTSAELVETSIEVRNGTWTHNLAHETRSALSVEGYNVTKIGNYIDFGAQKTLIYYRPGSERVARFLAHDFFPTAAMAESQKLRRGVDVRIILGYDLTKSPDLMARLGEGDEDW
jgi:cytochrome c-type biogenesis protein CcmH/NrfG